MKADSPRAKAATSAMADAVFAGRAGATTLPQAGAYGLVLLATKGAADAKLDPLPVPDEALDGERALRQLLDVPTTEKASPASPPSRATPTRRSG
ncbi:MAG: hypothetical protein IPQ09_15210 [Myxococcales bacterium]|nr:hypothetical protein [Myxococcales bacterium]